MWEAGVPNREEMFKTAIQHGTTHRCWYSHDLIVVSVGQGLGGLVRQSKLQTPVELQFDDLEHDAGGGEHVDLLVGRHKVGLSAHAVQEVP